MRNVIMNGLRRFNPYFIGLPILIMYLFYHPMVLLMFQSLFYWITYSYKDEFYRSLNQRSGFNPYFIGLPILIF